MDFLSQNLRPEQTNLIDQFKTNANFFLITPYTNQSFYIKAVSLADEQELTLVIMPTSADISREWLNWKDQSYAKFAATLTNDLFPNQTRHLMAEVAAGNYKVLFLTAESFLYWFSAGSNSMAVEHYRKLTEHDLSKQVFVNAQNILQRVSRLILHEFELAYPKNSVYKAKYLETISLIKELNIPILGLSSNSSDKVIQHISQFFPNNSLVQENLQLTKINLNAKYCLSRLDKQKHLINLLKEPKPTLIYVSAHEDLVDLVNFIKHKLPDLNLKTFQKELMPEHKAEALDYFFNDPEPVFIVNGDLMDGIFRPDMARLIHYSPPLNLAKFYKDLNTISYHNSMPVLESYLIACEDDMNLNYTQKDHLSKLYNKEGFSLNIDKQKKEFLNWISDQKNCRWQNLEKALTPHLQTQEKCGICDLCKGKKASILNSFFMFLAKNKLKN
jgi:superfamily II DNA helicase RecQ